MIVRSLPEAARPAVDRSGPGFDEREVLLPDKRSIAKYPGGLQFRHRCETVTNVVVITTLGFTTLAVAAIAGLIAATRRASDEIIVYFVVSGVMSRMYRSHQCVARHSSFGIAVIVIPWKRSGEVARCVDVFVHQPDRLT